MTGMPVPIRVLLVEDNLVDQLVVRRLLEKQGHSVVVAENGMEALLTQGKNQLQEFGLVLMNVQMPKMDGLDATEVIRAAEKGTGRHLPIVAMTAHAREEDRERCLAAGMDDFLSKPVRIHELLAAIDRLAGVGAKAAGAAVVAANQNHAKKRDLFPHLKDDPDLQREIAELFLLSSIPQMDAIRDAVARGDAAALERAAHALKGSVCNFSATDAIHAAQQLETKGREQNLNHAAEVFQVLQNEINALHSSLADFRKESDHEGAHSR